MLPIFRHLQQLGSVEQAEMFRTFNMGIGLICVVPPPKLRRAEAILARLGEPSFRIGRIVASRRGEKPAVLYREPELREPEAGAARRKPGRPRPA